MKCNDRIVGVYERFVMSRSRLNMVHVMEPMLDKFLVNPSTSEPVAHCVFDKALVSNEALATIHTGSVSMQLR